MTQFNLAHGCFGISSGHNLKVMYSVHNLCSLYIEGARAVIFRVVAGTYVASWVPAGGQATHIRR
jgi:hypothetical protein